MIFVLKYYLFLWDIKKITMNRFILPLVIAVTSILFFACNKSSSTATYVSTPYYDSVVVTIQNDSIIAVDSINLLNSPFVFNQGNDSLILFNSDSSISAFAANSLPRLDSSYTRGSVHNYVFITLPTTTKNPLKVGATYTLPVNLFNVKIAPKAGLPKMAFTNTDSSCAITIKTLNSTYISGTYSGNLYDASNDTAYVTATFKHHF